MMSAEKQAPSPIGAHIQFVQCNQLLFSQLTNVKLLTCGAKAAQYTNHSFSLHQRTAMKKLTLIHFVLLALLTVPASADQTFQDEAAWQAALTSDPSDQFDTSFDNVVIDDNTLEVELPFAQPWGFIDSTSSGLATATGLGVAGVEGFDGLAFDSDVCVRLNIDTSLGPLEGFSLLLGSSASIDVLIFDGDTLVDSFEGLAQADDDTPGISEEFFGWINCSNTNVTSIEICPTAQTPANVVFPMTFAFNAVAPEPSCQDLLQGVIDDLESILPLASSSDAYWIEAAIYDLTCAQDPTFWTDGNRLSDYGTGFFNKVFWATYALENVYDSQLVEGLLIDIQDLLGCVVDNEIEFAIQTGANDNLIEYANFFESFADAYSDAGLYLHAVLLHFYAWLFAANA